MLRGRTSGCKVSPAASSAAQTGHHQTSAGAIAAAAANDSTNWLAKAADAQGRESHRRPASWTTSKSNGSGETSSGAGLVPAPARTTAANERRLGSDAGRSGELASIGPEARDHSERDRPLLVHLLDQVRSAFARRSQRKESDKTATIQQHLRAIRHAENLDRQTHFRRSQGELI
jgi:hypothetical protein